MRGPWAEGDDDSAAALVRRAQTARLTKLGQQPGLSEYGTEYGTEYGAGGRGVEGTGSPPDIEGGGGWEAGDEASGFEGVASGEYPAVSRTVNSALSCIEGLSSRHDSSRLQPPPPPPSPAEGLQSARLCARLSAAQQSIAGAEVWRAGPPPPAEETPAEEMEQEETQEEQIGAAMQKQTVHAVAGELVGGLVSHAVERALGHRSAAAGTWAAGAAGAAAARSAEQRALFGVVCPPPAVYHVPVPE
jgi:hypothetical protein